MWRYTVVVNMTAVLYLVKLDVSSMWVMVLSGTLFDDDHGMSSQNAFAILQTDGSHRAIIMHSGSRRCRRVENLFMTAVFHEIIH